MEKTIKTDEEWKKILTPEQYKILREKGTELAGTGKWLNNNKKGTYHCIACGNLLYFSEDKFNSGTGWPSFTKAAGKFSVEEKDQFTEKYGHEREIVCWKCEGHHGHVFNDGPKPTGERFCMNGNVLEFKEEK